MDRTIFAAKTKRIGAELVITLPQQEVDKLQIAENEDIVVEVRKYLSHISPRAPRGRPARR